MTPTPSLALRHAAPILYARPGLDAGATSVAASTIAELCAARASTRIIPRWWHLVAGAELSAPDPVELMLARGVAPAAARIVAARIEALCAAERRRGAEVRWAGIANACAVPAPERPMLRAIGELAHTAAAAGADDTDLHVRTVLHPVGRGDWMGMLAGSIGRGELDASATLELLDEAGAAVADAHPDIHAWGAPAVVVSTPNHPGVPFACVVVRAASPAAIAELVVGTLVHDALSKAGADHYDVTSVSTP